MKTRTYTPRPMKYKQWRQIRKEMIALAVIVAALYGLSQIVEAASWATAHIVVHNENQKDSTITIPQ